MTMPIPCKQNARHWRAALRILGPLTAFLFTACEPAPPSGPREELCAGNGCSRECRELDVGVCDIRERACQEIVFQSVRCVRGSSLSQLPPTDFVPQSDFGNPDAAAEWDAGAIAELPPEVVAQAVWEEYLDEGLQLMHLIAQPLAVARAEEGKATGGITTGGSVAIADNNADQLWWSMRLLAHEYVHTMQEHDYGGIGSLYGRHSRSSVTSQGVQAFIEGEAELYAWLAHAFMRNRSITDWNLEEFFDLDEKSVRTRVANTDSPWTTARQWQHYAIGARYLYKTWERSKNIGVRSVMYNLKADFGVWASGFEPKRGPAVSERELCQPPGNHTIMQDSLGPSGVFAILMAASRATDATVAPTEYAWRIATDLTNDVIRMYGPAYAGAVSQAEWMERDAKLAMCKPASSAGGAPADAGLGDGGTGDAGGAATLAPQPLSDAGVACDAGYVASLEIGDAGSFAHSTDTPFGELQKHLVPGAPTWVTWAFTFENKDSASAFTSWIEDAKWPTLRVAQRGQSVVLRNRRTPTSDAERATFDAWTCR